MKQYLSPAAGSDSPAHRHDYERPGKEVVLDEIFSFQMTSEGTGKGGVLQHGYDLTDDNKKLWDEVNVIEGKQHRSGTAQRLSHHRGTARHRGVSAGGSGRR